MESDGVIVSPFDESATEKSDIVASLFNDIIASPFDESATENDDIVALERNDIVAVLFSIEGLLSLYYYYCYSFYYKS